MKIPVNLQEDSYDILIEKGSIAHIGERLREISPAKSLVMITDDQVNQLYGEQVARSLIGAGFKVSIFEFPAGEVSKSLKTAEEAWEFCAKSALTRSDAIVALGGGVVGDLAGFVASTYMRGISFVQIPTSLTAQVDSSVGGKTGINSPFAKNMIGTFSQPSAVFIDTDLLKTLDERALREGMGEVIKCALIADYSLWKKLEEMSGDDILKEADFLVSHSVQIKAAVVSEDELDQATRLSLNFGHTIGHAIEASAGFGKIMHGEAVAIGMLQISSVAEKKGLIESGLANKIQAMLEKFHLPTKVEFSQEQLMQALLHDKKISAERIKIILVPEIGRYEIHEIDIEEMSEYCS